MAPSTIPSPSLFLSMCFLVGLIIHNTIAAPTESSNYVYALCPDMISVAPNSKFQTNINTVLSFLSSNSSNKNHFYNTTVGSGTDKVYGLFFCRADVTITACQHCVSLATNALTTSCPGKKVSIVWYFDRCVVRYSNEPFMGTMTDTPMIPMWNRLNTLDIWNVTCSMTSFMHVLLGALGDASAKAASGPLDRKFGTKEASFASNLTNSSTLYTLAECTPDISLSDCKRCLNMVIGNTSALCNEKTGCTLMCPNCNMRYDIFPFYGDAATGPPSVPLYGETSAHLTWNKRDVLIAATTAAALLIMVAISGVWILFNKRKSSKSIPDLKDIENVESLKFDFNTLRSATSNFSEEKKLGEGGFGEVFKGKLENGQEVAVKRLSKNSCQGNAEFKTELLLVAKLQHRNLVKLLGFCLSRSEKLLVYEFMPNLSLDHFLLDSTTCASLDWGTRYKIICGIAKGLLYLHEDSRLKIIHRDLKSSNVLLDKDMNPKISDFGMARHFGADQTQGNTKKISGTFGYMAPEYVITGHFSAKSDVYSFGVIVLEIVSGQRNVFFRRQEDESLLHRAWRLWNEELLMHLIDSTLEKNFALEEVKKCIHIGLLCIQEDAGRRPRMASVVSALNGDSIVLPLPTPPHFFTSSACGEIQVSELQAFTGAQSITVVDPR